MKIAHISDIHIRNIKFRSEYNEAFNNLYEKLNELKPDLVINTGDTVHAKLAVSPELFDDVAYHIKNVTDIAPYWIILGNHDLNLKNKDRTDAISPIVRAMQGSTWREIKLLSAGCSKIKGGRFDDFAFWNHDIRGYEPFQVDENDINIGLYHGSISGCETDIGFVMEHGEAEVKQFSNMDYVLLGDIHKRQSFRNGTIAYPGSLIQQNYGEDLEKGFLLWEISSKTDFTTTFYPIKTHSRFYTISVPASFDVSSFNIPAGSRIRAMYDGELPVSKRIVLENSISDIFKPAEIIIPDSTASKVKLGSVEIDQMVGSRKALMQDHLMSVGIYGDKQTEIIELFEQYEKSVDNDISNSRGSTWKLNKIQWDDMLNYGEGNFIDFNAVSGLVGIFAANASGKSSIFDILLEGLFDKVPKDVPKNIDLINDNKDSGKINIDFSSGDNNFSIERKIEKINYDKKKSDVKQWGKTSLDFLKGETSLNGNTRAETEKAIRSVIGSFEDFVLTAMITQNPVFGIPGGGDIINCKETDRRKILFRFLDLDLYEQINSLVKDDLKQINLKLKKYDEKSLNEDIEKLRQDEISKNSDIESSRLKLTELENLLAEIKLKVGDVSLGQLFAQKLKVDNEIASIREEQSSMNTNHYEEIVVLKDERNEILSKLHALNKIKLSDVSLKIDEIRQRRDSNRAAAAEIKHKIEHGKKSLITLDGIPCEGKFPNCKFISQATTFLAEQNDLELALRELSIHAAHNDEIISEHEIVNKNHLKYEKEISQLDLKISKLENEKYKADTKFDDLSRHLNTLCQQSGELKEKIQQINIEDYDKAQAEELKISNSIKELKKHIDSLLKSSGVISEKISNLEKDFINFNELTKQSAVYEQLADMTGKSGLPYRILTMVLPAINSEIAKILSGVVKFNVFFENDEDDQTVSLYIQYGDYRSRPLGLGSGAEKFISSIAIRAALLSVTSLPKTDILVIDEGFGKLDAEHLESLQKIFQYLKSSFKTVFMISHVDFMRDIVDYSIEITKSESYAHVEVG